MENKDSVVIAQDDPNKISVPTVELEKFLEKKDGWEEECNLVTRCLKETGIVILRDPVDC